jgi:hypothetical protein
VVVLQGIAAAAAAATTDFMPSNLTRFHEKEPAFCLVLMTLDRLFCPQSPSAQRWLVDANDPSRHSYDGSIFCFLFLLEKHKP